MASFFKKGDRFFGFLRYHRNKNGEVVLRPVVGRILAFLSAVAVAGWMTAALAVMVFVQQVRDFQGGRYVDIVFPWRWDGYRVAWGEEFIERGLALLEEGEFQEAIHMIRVGHVHSPTNLKARLFLAELHAARGRPDLASRLLRDGLPYAGDDLDFLRTTFRSLINTQNDEAVREIANEILSGEPVLTPRNQITALAAATASFHRGDYDQAEDFLVDYGLSTHSEGRILLARIDWESGNQQAALDRLGALSDQFTDQEDVYILLTRYHRELGNHSKAHNYAVMRQVNNPLSAAPRVALLYSHESAGDLARVQHVVEGLFRDFGHDQEALLGVGEFAVHTNDVELARRVFQAMDRRGFPLHLPAILLAESYLGAGQFREAIRFLESHSRDNAPFVERYEPMLDSIYALSHLGLGDSDTGEMHLSRFLNARNLRAENFLVTSKHLVELGHPTLARRVLRHANRADPSNQAALAEWIRLDLDMGHSEELVRNINRLLTMRKPPRTLLTESFTVLRGDQFLFLPEREDLLRSIEQMIQSESVSGSPLSHS